MQATPCGFGLLGTTLCVDYSFFLRIWRIKPLTTIGEQVLPATFNFHFLKGYMTDLSKVEAVDCGITDEAHFGN